MEDKEKVKVEDDGSETVEAAVESSSVDGGVKLPPPVDEALLAEMIEMGFPRNRAIRGLFYGGSTMDAAITWIGEHDQEPDINDPLPADAVAEPKKELTAEEKAAKAQELKQRIAENRRIQAENEKIAEKTREKERIQRGKHMAETRKVVEEQERQRAIDLRRKDKEDEARERERLRQLLREDRIRRFGVEKANELEKQSEEAAARKKEQTELLKKKQAEEKAMREASGQDETIDMEKALKAMSAAVVKLDGNPTEVRKTCYLTMAKYITNIINQPSEVKFRKIRRENAAFQKRVIAADGGLDYLLAVGFREDIEEGFLVLSHSDMFLLNRVRGDLELYSSKF
mmetsp:Transcript_7725/g.34270  ORF Transcript_7725/g.34270 Transcript_7725/m.34270 type:complete len:343 (-) Transcript_7725:1807-2835(-)